MRVRLHQLASHHADALGKLLNRSPTQITALALAEFYWHHVGNKMQAMTAIDEGAVASRSMLACHASNPLCAAIRHFAEREQRSLSSAMRVLLRDALRAHGVLVASNPAETTTGAS